MLNIRLETSDVNKSLSALTIEFAESRRSRVGNVSEGDCRRGDKIVRLFSFGCFEGISEYCVD